MTAPLDIALSLRQPWAWLIVEGYKNIENRRWKRTPPPRFYIHASKTMTRADYAGAVEVAAAVDPGIQIPRGRDLLFGGVVGRVECTGVLPYADPDLVERGRLVLEPWRMAGQYGYLVSGAERVPFVPCVGALGFFRLPRAAVIELAKESSHE